MLGRTPSYPRLGDATGRVRGIGHRGPRCCGPRSDGRDEDEEGEGEGEGEGDEDEDGDEGDFEEAEGELTHRNSGSLSETAPVPFRLYHRLRVVAPNPGDSTARRRFLTNCNPLLGQTPSQNFLAH
jgi:hypothetical protein